jgi:hypothetical protein
MGGSRVKLIERPLQVLRHISTWALTVGAGLQAAWLGIPGELRADLPDWAGQSVAWITLAVAIWGLGGKVIKQDLP